MDFKYPIDDLNSILQCLQHISRVLKEIHKYYIDCDISIPPLKRHPTS